MYVNEEEKLKAIMLAQDLRMSGISCDYDTTGRSLKSQFKEADRNKADLLVILNSEDLNRGLITVKDNLTKEETKVDENEIIDYIVSRG
jgi:histidyl-tRNA synthetase